MVMPVPRFLARSHFGERSIRNRRPARVASRRTRGATPSVGVVGPQSAWRRCGRRGRRRTARSRRRRARWSCRRRWGRSSRKRPASESASKSTSTVSANGPNAVTLEGVQAHQPPPRRRTSRSGSSQQASQASRSRADSAGVAGTPRSSATKSRAMSWSRRPATVATRPAIGAAADGVEREDQRVREAACAAAPSPAAGRGWSVRVTWTQSSLVRGEGRIGEQGVELAGAAGPAAAAPAPRRSRAGATPCGVEVDQPASP